MARLRTLADMETDTRRLADLESAGTTLRFTQPEVWEYINKGIAYVYGEMVVVMDRPFFQKDYSFRVQGSNTIPGTTQQTVYPLPVDFLQILSVFWATTPGGPWAALDPYEEAERVNLINSGYYGAMWPQAYGIVGGVGALTQGTVATAYSIEILPQPPFGSVVQLRYVPTCPRLLQANDTLDGVLGFEDAACTWAAVLMRRKDDLPTEELERDMARHIVRIRSIAKRRDRSRPPRVQIVRNRYGAHGPRRGWRYGSW